MDSGNIVFGAFRYLVNEDPEETTPALPADSVAYGGTWPTGWEEGGFTDENGFNAGGLSAESTSVMTSQQLPSVMEIQQNVTEMIGFTSLESDLAQLRMFAGRGIISTVAPGTSTYGHDEVEWTTGPVRVIALGVEGYGPNGQPRRMVYPRVIARITGDLNYRQTTPLGVPVEFRRVGGSEANPKWRDVKPPTG